MIFYLVVVPHAVDAREKLNAPFWILLPRPTIPTIIGPIVVFYYSPN